MVPFLFAFLFFSLLDVQFFLQFRIFRLYFFKKHFELLSHFFVLLLQFFPEIGLVVQIFF